MQRSFGHGLSPTLFAAAPRLRWVQSAAAGVASLPFPAMRASDVKLTNSAGVMGDTIAEHVLGGVIYLLRSFDIAVPADLVPRSDGGSPSLACGAWAYGDDPS